MGMAFAAGVICGGILVWSVGNLWDAIRPDEGGGPILPII